jgi:predicted lipoprotein with Yx(FWY)xxD motif
VHARPYSLADTAKEVEMQRIGLIRGSLLLVAALAAALIATLLVTRSGHASDNASRTTVRTVHNAALGKTILVNRRGLTLYSLSAERHGQFICTSMSCLSLWKPLVVHAGAKPTGVRGLATVKRPDARRQVAYRGAPLYRFVEDTKPGQGNGFRDVGVWRPVVVGGGSAPAPASSGGGTSPYSY